MFTILKKNTVPQFSHWYKVMTGTLGYEATLGSGHIMGWRNVLPKGFIGGFNDYISVIDKDHNFHIYPATTVPGIPMLLSPINPKGTAIMALGHYKDTYTFGLHKGHDALVQIRPVSVFRDNTKDDKLDMESDSVEVGIFGINIHRAGVFSKVVGNWSAGCQVFQKEADFLEFLDICRQTDKLIFSYTLTGFVYDR